MAVAPTSPRTIHEPPKNLDAERTVLGSALIANNTIDIIVDLLKQEHFYPTAHKEVFLAIKKLHAEELPVDLISVAEYLERMGRLEVVGGRAYLAEFEQHVLTTQNIEYYCGLVLATWQRREIIQASHETIEDAYNEELENSDLFSKAEKRLRILDDDKSTGGLEGIQEIALGVMTDLERRSADDEIPSNLIALGFKDLDFWLGGIELGSVVTIAGRTSGGKTSMVHNIIKSLGMVQKLRGAMFHLEGREGPLIHRFQAMIAQVPASKIKAGLRTKDESKRKARLLKVAEATELIAAAPIDIDCTPNQTIGRIRSRLRRLKRDYPDLKWMSLDYLQLLRPEDNKYSKANREQEVAEFSRSLKLLAMELEIVIFSLAQINRNPDMRKDKRPGLGDLRESGAIENDSDIVIFPHGMPDRKAARFMQPHKMEFILAKARDGSVATVPITWIGTTVTFRDYDPIDYQEDSITGRTEPEYPERYVQGMEQ